MIFDVKERSFISGETKVDVEGNNEGRAGIKLSLNNITGNADTLVVSGSRSSGASTTFEAVYSIPAGHKSAWPIVVGAYQSVSDFQAQSSHLQKQRGIFGSYKTYSPWAEHTFRYDGLWRTLEVPSTKASFDVREQAGHSLKSSLTHTAVLDGTDTTGNNGTTAKVISIRG